ncbi:MAG: endonuclease domain-containing protein [Chloroflexi bacterium]|nr:endonuclease domain-containing protein [Chloroflexota bacterium]
MTQRYVVRGQVISQEKFALAKELRRNMTEAEKILWQNLRTNKLGGWHFRRQQIIHGYIVDFYCHTASLIIEVDGEIHESQKAADHERDAVLESKSFRIIHFRNHEIEHNLDAVLSKILEACNQTPPNQPNSPPRTGEGPGERSGQT